jgi:small GTP-binding protein
MYLAHYIRPDNEKETLILREPNEKAGGLPLTPLRKEKLKAKVCMVGDSSVGKTSLIRRYVFDDFEDKYLATLGAKVTKKLEVVPFPELGVEYEIAMIIYDIMGAKEFRSLLREAYFFGAQGLIAVCDMTSGETFESLEDWILNAYNVTGQVPIELLGNKVDLKDDLVISESEIKKLSESYGGPHKLTSAKTGANVEPAFGDIARLLAKRNLRAKLIEN